jgi:hypothetical protein
MSKGFLDCSSINPKWHCLLCLCQLPGNSALSRVVCTLLELVPCSPQLALCVQMHELCARPMLLTHLHPQGPVFDLMCVPTVMYATRVQSKQDGWCRPVATLITSCPRPISILCPRDQNINGDQEDCRLDLKPSPDES